MSINLYLAIFVGIKTNLYSLMKKSAIIGALLCSSFISQAQISEVTDIDDLALIYIGSQHRPDWNKDLFRPYVMHEYPDGTQSWMFDGFLMIEFQIWNKSGQVVSLGESNGYGAQKEDWENLIDAQLGIKTGLGCKALDELIGELIPVLGEPGHKHKVVFTLPIPELKSGATWGEINGRALNFQSVADRISALKWYVDLVMELWNECDFKNIELDGVYWTKESFSNDDKFMISQANDYFHRLGLLTYWIPYFTAGNRFQWNELGMDVAYLQPNYYFNANTPKTQLYKAIDDAWEHEMGLEIEFEGYNFGYDPVNGVRTKYAPGNMGLYGFSPAFYQRLVDYLDAFDDEAVFEFLPIAYYTGFQAVYDFMTSGNNKDKELMNRLAEYLNARHVVTGWDKEPSAGIDDVMIADYEIAYGVNGAIYIADKYADKVTIYSLDGKTVYTSSANVKGEKMFYGRTVECRPGVYVVRADGKSVKVVVK